MKTHNLVIYHCLGCGAVQHHEPEHEVPRCCGKPMTKAAAKTVIDARNGTAAVRTEDPTAASAASSGLQKKPR